MKTKLFYFILGGIIFSSITAIAISVGADEIQYDSTHTVKDKIDDLYNIATNYKNLSQTTTVASNKMLNGFTAYDNSGNLVTGNIPTYNGTTIFNASYSNQTATTAGKYVADDIVINGMASTYKNLTETTDVTGSALLYNVVAYNSSGQTVTGSIKTYNGSTNVTPTTTSQTLTTNGKYLDSNITVNAIPSEYVDISDSTITTATDVAVGKTAYKADGTMITGTLDKDSVTILLVSSGQNSYAAFNLKPTQYTKVKYTDYGCNSSNTGNVYAYDSTFSTTTNLTANTNYTISNTIYRIYLQKTSGSSWCQARVTLFN